MAWFKRLLSSPYLWLTGLLALGAVLRVWNIGVRDLWLDEAFSALYAELPLETLVELRRQGTNPPLYHILLGWWVRGFGDGEQALRMMSAVAGMVVVGLGYPLGCRLGGKRTGLIACALLAVNNWAICYSQEARYYALTEALAMATTLLLYDALTTRRPGRLIAYTVVAAAFVWVHTFAWFVLLAQAVWAAMRLRAMPNDDRRYRLGVWLGMAGVAIVLAFVPWIPILADQIRTATAEYWVPPPRWIDLGNWAQGMIAPWPHLRLALLAACALVVAAKLFHGPRGDRRQAPHAPPLERVDSCYLLLWMLAPLVIPLGWSLVGTPIFQPKYAIVSQPAALILLAHLGARRSVVCATCYGAFILLSLFAMPQYADCPLVREDWRAAARLIDTHAAPDARVFVYRDYCHYPLRYYLDADRSITPVFHPDKPHSEFADLYPGPGVPFEHLLKATHGDDEVWIVLARLHRYTEHADYEALIDALCRCRSCARHPLRGIEVLRLGSVIAAEDELRHDGK